MRVAQVVLGLLAVCSSASSAGQGPIVIENAHVRYTISAEGRNLAFVDRALETDYLRHDRPSACALVRSGGVEHPPTSAVLVNGRLTIQFNKVNARAVLRVESSDSYIRFAVDSVSGENIESLVFLNVPLTLKG